jgi:hypothetical protein
MKIWDIFFSNKEYRRRKFVLFFFFNSGPRKSRVGSFEKKLDLFLEFRQLFVQVITSLQFVTTNS